MVRTIVLCKLNGVEDDMKLFLASDLIGKECYSGLKIWYHLKRLVI